MRVASAALLACVPAPPRACDVRMGGGPLDARCIRRRAMLLAPLTPLATCALSVSADDSARGFVLAQPERNPLQSRWLEQLRILMQDQADAALYGGELAPGGPPAAANELLLAPVLQLFRTLRKCEPLLADQESWAGLAKLLTSGPFETPEFKRIFNAYSDNIYYAASSSEANAYLLGGATPSSRQTQQYLLRNEVLKQLGELVDELEYQQRQPKEKRDAEVAQEYMAAALGAFREYIGLAPPEDVKRAGGIG